MCIPSNPNLEYLAGKNIKSFRPFAPFDSILCDFLQDTSSELINRPESRKYPGQYVCLEGSGSRYFDRRDPLP